MDSIAALARCQVRNLAGDLTTLKYPGVFAVELREGMSTVTVSARAGARGWVLEHPDEDRYARDLAVPSKQPFVYIGWDQSDSRVGRQFDGGYAPELFRQTDGVVLAAQVVPLPGGPVPIVVPCLHPQVKPVWCGLGPVGQWISVCTCCKAEVL